MKHAFWDRHAVLDSPLHKLHVSVKLQLALVVLATLLIFTAFIPSVGVWFIILLAGLTLSIAGRISTVPPSYLLSRSALVIPFSVLIVIVNYFSGNFSLDQMLQTIFKSTLSILTIVLLISTTPFHEILKQLGKWGTPRLIILIFSFMYRYFFLLIAEIEALEKAVAMRHSSLSGWRRFKTYTQMIGMLLIRSFDRSERVFHAMQMRGFTGDLR